MTLARRLVAAGRRDGAELQVEIDQEDAIFEMLSPGQTGGGQHGQHSSVGGEHLPVQRLEAEGSPDGDQVLHQQGSEAAALICVGDQERDFGTVDGRPGTQGAPDHARHGDEGQAIKGGVLGEEPNVVAEIELGKVGELGVGERRLWGEEALVDRLIREESDAFLQGAPVLWPNCPDDHRGAVAKGRLDPVPGELHARGM